MSERNTVVLVNEQDQPLGTEEKLLAHQKGLLHRAFSVMLYRYMDNKLQFLLQKRSKNKYHCPGLWTNTCCSHPAIEEDVVTSALKRLEEELVDIDTSFINLQNIGNFIYRAEFDNGLVEHEYDYVLIAEYKDLPVSFNSLEIAELAWVDVEQLRIDLEQHSGKYTPWLSNVVKLCLQNI